MKSLQKERIDLIYKLTEEKTYVKYSDIAKNLNISEATIRRDVKKMETLGLINIISGGIEIRNNNNDIEYNLRIKKNLNQKKSIAKNASKYINRNETIFLDAGTTTFELIPYLKNMNITVITNAITHIEALIDNNINFILLGGKVKEITKAIIGTYAIKQLEHFNFDKCFLGSNGVDDKFGFSTPDIEEALIKEAVCNRSKQKFILADKSKIGLITNASFANLKDCTLITEEDK